MGCLKLILYSRSDIVDVFIITELATGKCEVNTTKEPSLAVGRYSAIGVLYIQKAKIIGLIRGEAVLAVFTAPTTPYLGVSSGTATVEHFGFVMVAEWA